MYLSQVFMCNDYVTEFMFIISFFLFFLFLFLFVVWIFMLGIGQFFLICMVLELNVMMHKGSSLSSRFTRYCR